MHTRFNPWGNVLAHSGKMRFACLSTEQRASHLVAWQCCLMLKPTFSSMLCTIFEVLCLNVIACHLQALLFVGRVYQRLCQIHADKSTLLDSQSWADLSTSLRQCLNEACTVTISRQNSCASEEEVLTWLSCAESMLDSFLTLTPYLPGSVRSVVPLTGDTLSCATAHNFSWKSVKKSYISVHEVLRGKREMKQVELFTCDFSALSWHMPDIMSLNIR